MSIFQRQRRVYLVQATGWKQYLPCFSGPAEVPASGFQLPPVFVQNCMSSMLYKGETQICPPKWDSRQITPHPWRIRSGTGASLGVHLKRWGIIWGDNEYLDNFSFTSGRREDSWSSLTPRWAFCLLMKAEEDPISSLAFLQKRRFMRMASQGWRFTVNVLVFLWVGQLWTSYWRCILL